MDRRSWPWKKKSSDKIISDKVVAVEAVVDSANGSVSDETPTPKVCLPSLYICKQNCQTYRQLCIR